MNQYNKFGNKEGYWEEYHVDSNQLAYKGKYVCDKEEGHWEAFFYNQKICWKGYFINGLLDGYYEQYRSTGELISFGFYTKGERIGCWEQYDGNLFKSKTFHV